MIYLAFTREKFLLSLAKNLLLASSTLTLTACGVLSGKMPWSNEPDPVDYALISTNLVDAISQYPKLSPLMATVQVTKPDNAFERQVHEQMSELGFKLESVNDGQGANGVEAVILSATPDSLSAAPLYVLSIGDISAERNYDTIDGRTFPASELTLRGGGERVVTLNDSELFDEYDGALSTVAFKPYDGPEISDMMKPLEKQNAESNVVADDKPAVVKHNMYDTMTSNYSEIYTEYEDVDQKILVFPNDSLRLGETNKLIIEEYVSMMEPETDVLSVIGCSHGKTNISNGNALLALGRANRVKEALMFSGVDHDLVMEEGCWAPRHFDEVMPRRGVVLTLKRKSS